jgi:hypothetical protein
MKVDFTKIATEATAIAEAVSGVSPIITTAVQLGTLLKSIGTHLSNAPKNADGSDVTLDQAKTRLASATLASQIQDDKIRAETAANLAENAKDDNK